MRLSLCAWRCAWLALCLAACSSDRAKRDAGSAHAGDASASASASAPEDFCQDFLSAVCDHYEHCGCERETIEECRAGVARCAMPSQFDARELLARGEVVFDAEAWSALRARLRDPKTSCNAVHADLAFDSVSVFSLGGVFKGTLESGASCVLPVGQRGGINSCKPGALCLEDERGESRCATLASRGEACDLGLAPRRVCFDRRAPDNDDEFESAFDFLTCVADGPGASTGTCRAELDVGTTCTMDESCKSGRCAWDENADVAKCSAKLANGASCDYHSDCMAGGCADERCGPPAPNGAKCGYDDLSCASKVCYTPDDQTSSTSPGVCGPKLDKPLGASCAQGYECASGVCRGDKCLNAICG